MRSKLRIGKWVIHGWKAEIAFTVAVSAMFVAGFVLGMMAVAHV